MKRPNGSSFREKAGRNTGGQDRGADADSSIPNQIYGWWEVKTTSLLLYGRERVRVNVSTPTEWLHWNGHQLHLQLLELFSHDQWSGRGRSRFSQPVKTDGAYYFQISESNCSWTLRFLRTGFYGVWKNGSRQEEMENKKVGLNDLDSVTSGKEYGEMEVCLHSNQPSTLKCCVSD